MPCKQLDNNGVGLLVHGSMRSIYAAPRALQFKCLPRTDRQLAGLVRSDKRGRLHTAPKKAGRPAVPD